MLGITNKSFTLMKKRTSILMIIIAVFILSLGAWIYFSVNGSFEGTDLLQYVIILVLVAFALLILVRRLRSERRGEPAEDELSKKIMQRTAASSYYISLYWLLVLAYIGEDWQMERGSLVGTGILGMAIIFALCWFFYKIRGVGS
jgi:peptidoglycan/LPS O-acetylase OafA/YrhL